MWRSVLPLLLVLAACGTTRPPAPEVTMPGPVRLRAPDNSLYVRASFDDDPTSYVGRMLPAGLAATEVDEGAAFQSRCSKFVAYKSVKASGTFEQRFNASSGVKGSLGVAGVGGVSGSSGAEAGLLVKYALTQKLIGEVKDPDGFFQCCKAAPEQCTERMIGEFLRGTGTVAQYAGSADEVKAGGSYKMANAALEYKDGAAWKRVTTFEDVYFAFKTTATGAGAKAGGVCTTDWARRIPSSLDGQYFVGVSPGTGSESQAFELALRDARKQVIRYLGEAIRSRYTETSRAVEGLFDDETLVEASAEGVASLVKDECRGDVETTPTPDGLRHVARVLAFFPASKQAEGMAAATDAMSAQLQARGRAGEAEALKAAAERARAR